MINKIVFLLSIFILEKIKIGRNDYEVHNDLLYIEADYHDRSRFDLKYSFYLLSDEKCSDCYRHLDNLESLASKLKADNFYTSIVKGNKYVFGLHNDKDSQENFYIGFGNRSFKYSGKLNYEEVIKFFKDKYNENFKQAQNQEELSKELTTSKENTSFFAFYGDKESEEFKELEFIKIYLGGFELRILKENPGNDKLYLINYNNFKDEENQVNFNLEWKRENIRPFLLYNSHQKFSAFNKSRLNVALQEKANVVLLFVENKYKPKFENFTKAIKNLPKNALYSYLEFEQDEIEEDEKINFLEISTILGNFLNIPLVSQELFVVIEFNQYNIKKSRVNVYNEYFSEKEINRYLIAHQSKYSEDYNQDQIEKHSEL